jgi:hypothetical protein
MCIIVQQPKGHSFTDEDIRDFYHHNPHGFGLMHHDGRHLRTGRWMVRDEADAVRLYRRYADGKECILHYRWATHGPRTKDYAHPFRVGPGVHVVHNGVLHGWGGPHESDTAHYVREVLAPSVGVNPGLLEDPRFLKALHDDVRGSALVFMDSAGRVTRVGSDGVMHDGCWYSNTYAWTHPDDRRMRRMGGRVWWLDDEDEKDDEDTPRAVDVEFETDMLWARWIAGEK